MSKLCLVRKLFVALTAEFQCSSQIKRLTEDISIEGKSDKQKSPGILFQGNAFV
jgi:hypothetical protein